MIRILFMAFMLCVSIINAQTSKKQHFIIHPVDNSTDVTKYEQAAESYGQLDQYRFYDKRRTIYFTDSKATIELYSAKELLTIYGKEISPLTIKSEVYTPITFDVSMDGKSLKPQIIK
ncbi:MAG: hypothetical protein ACXVNM_12720 [Bacteroidia bacterium]